MIPAGDTVEVVVQTMSVAADDVLMLELRRAGGGTLPTFAAGAHVDLHLPGGIVRSYSLLNPMDAGTCYRLAVHRHPSSRGGSRCVHESLRVGQHLLAGVPRNEFELDECASLSILVAGGIGITPLWSMAQRLESLGRAWELHYAARTRGKAALLSEVEAFASASRHGRMQFHATREAGGRRIDLVSIVALAPAGAHLYCCGPAEMVDAFIEAACDRPRSEIHVERFESAAPVDTAGAFTVHLVRSGRSMPVPAGRTLLAVLVESGIAVPHSCEQGICGSCEVPVIDGQPDHRDSVLTDREKQANRTMLVCCSRAKSASLTLDL